MSDPIKVVLLSGQQGVGKSHLARAADVDDSCSLCRLSFADPIYEALADMLCISVEELRGMDKSTKLASGKTIRQALQFIGTEAGRELVCDDVWVLKVKDRIDNIHRNFIDTAFIIDDARFKNELDGPLQADSRYRCIHVRIRGEAPEQANDHVSEADWPNIDPDEYFYNDRGPRSAPYFVRWVEQL